MRPEAPSRRPKGTGRQFALEFLRRRILMLEYAPGATLDEAMLVEQVGVSRTLVREAIIRLTSEGLIEVLPNRGARVAGFDLNEVKTFHEALELNQRAVTCWAAIRGGPTHHAKITRMRHAFEKAADARDAEGMIESNRQFHLSIAEASGNSVVEASYGRLLTTGLRLSRLLVTYDFSKDATLASHLDRIVDQHRKIELAIINHDSQVAEKLGAAHARLSLDRALASLGDTLASRISLPDPR
jgi:DNA-binding GntR family transcriptional regulator